MGDGFGGGSCAVERVAVVGSRGASLASFDKIPFTCSYARNQLALLGRSVLCDLCHLLNRNVSDRLPRTHRTTMATADLARGGPDGIGDRLPMASTAAPESSDPIVFDDEPEDSSLRLLQ